MDVKRWVCRGGEDVICLTFSIVFPFLCSILWAQLNAMFTLESIVSERKSPINMT